MENIKEKNNKKLDEKLVKLALERFKLCEEQETDIRAEALTDLQFRKGDHWPEQIKQAREQDNRPCLTINKMPQFVRKVANDQKQNRPAIIVNPVDDYADLETAEIFQGLIRNIENVSDAEYAYDRAFEGAAAGSFGFFRVLTDYESHDSFDQEIRIEMIDNPFKVYLDPDSVRPDGSDANYGFIVDDLTKDEFIEEYGKSKLANHANWQMVSEGSGGWIKKDTVRIVEYFYKEYKKVQLFELSDGKTYFKDELPEQNDDSSFTMPVKVQNPMTGQVEEVYQDLTVENERETQKCVVKWVKLNAIEILEKTDWMGSYIPIIPVYGDVLNIDGEIVRESVIRHSRDSQRILNFWTSSEAEMITLAPKAPFIGVEGQFKGHEAEWSQANTKNFPYLEYRQVSHDGSLAGAPQRNSFEAPVMAITQARALANEDIKATTGIYDASLGGQSNETSGIAIQRRNAQSENSNFHLFDNLSKSIRHCGRIIVELIPKVYDTERVIRVLGLDGKVDRVKINSVDNLLKDQKRHYDLSIGKYDVAVSTGPSYETKRQEARDSMLAMSGSNPKFADLAGDLMVKNMDWPGAQEIAERLKRAIPPEILGNDNENEDVPPQVQAAMAQMNKQIEMLNGQLNEAKQIISTDSHKLQSNERIQAMKIEADMRRELLKIEGDKQLSILKGEVDLLKEKFKVILPQEPVSDVLESEIYDNNPPVYYETGVEGELSGYEEPGDGQYQDQKEGQDY